MSSVQCSACLLQSLSGSSGSNPSGCLFSVDGYKRAGVRASVDRISKGGSYAEVKESSCSDPWEVSSIRSPAKIKSTFSG